MFALKSEHRLDDLLEAAGLARSTYFYHQKRLLDPTRGEKHAVLKQAIVEVFHRNKHRYGYRRVLLELRKAGGVVNHKLVYKLMDRMGLKAVIRRSKKYSSHPGRPSHIAENLLQRNFRQDSPNSAWVSDITEFHVAGQKLYLSPIMDLHDRMILVHTIAKAPTTTMTAQTLDRAIKEHQPAPGLMVHTDQGLHYQHSSWRDLITQAGAEQSMSRKGNCFDNAVMENFFGQLKTEMYYNQKFSSFEQLEQAIDSYITWYNTQRLQTQFKGQTPTEKRHQALQPQPK